MNRQSTVTKSDIYRESIDRALARSGHAGQYDARHIEAWMRNHHSTLDQLSPAQFDAAVEQARRIVDLFTPSHQNLSERLAKSFGL